MRRAALIAVPALALALAGCGGEVVRPVAETVVGEYTQTTQTQPGPTLPKGNAAAGEAIFKSKCGACHTLKAAGSTGTVGPNLDDLAPELARIQTQVINGGAQMPPFKGVLTDQQIADVSQYVYESTHS